MGAFFNLRAASPDEEDSLAVLHEVNKAKAITAKEIVFNIGLSPIELLVDRYCVLRELGVARVRGNCLDSTITARC